MTGKSITGNIRISDCDYPYSYQSETEKITVYIGTKAIIIPENTDVIIGQKFGMLTGGKILYKLSVPLSNDCMTFEDGKPIYVSMANQTRTVEYSIEDYEANSHYTEMRLQFPELDYFIPSLGSAKVSDEEIVISRIRQTLYSFEFIYHDTQVTISFDTKMDGKTNVKIIAETVSEVVLTFPATDDLEFLCGLYDTVRCFFSFLCNRENIGLRNAVLVGTHPIKKIENGVVVDIDKFTSQKIYFSQKYLEPEEDRKQVANTPNVRLFAEKIPELFRLFSQETADAVATVNRNSIHHSTKYRNLIDLEQSLHITATFEYYVRSLLPEMSSASTTAFISDLSVLLDEYIERSSGKKKQKAEKFKKSLSPQIPLEEKIKKVYNGFSTWQPLKPLLTEWFGDDISALANATNSWRNELAHEKREYQPTVDVINAVRLIEHINYCIVFRHVGYSDEQIKSIITEILVR